MTHVHFVGISGSGLSAIARVLLESGYTVSGSDRTPTAAAEELAQLGATIYAGHAAANLSGADLVVRSSAVPDDNVEVTAALQSGIPVLKRSQFLQTLLAGKSVIAIAGTHGKTTTTAMIAWVLARLGNDPSFIIGGVSKDLGANAHAGKGTTFVIEADEYDRMFLGLSPVVCIVTYLEHDHPDCYPTPEVYRQAFVDFIHLLQPGGLLLVNGDHSPTASLAEEVAAGSKACTYGTQPGVNYMAVDVLTLAGGGTSFTLLYTDGQDRQNLGVFTVNLPGRHNLLNGLAVLALAHQQHLPLEKVGEALSLFSGTGRRFDLLGTAYGVTIINDYAHHPTEIKATLQAARARFPENRIWAVWQPHTYSRTRTLLADFAAAFSDADQVLVTEVYAARESNPGFSAIQVARQISGKPVHFSPTLEDATQTLVSHLQPGDVLLVLSAGDADQISRDVFFALQKKEPSNG